ncbi:hypothetical protein [Haloechinothrix sp. LS1_15]|nr:hypothetical protein [Haloechinothrix sp. LS1_15]
MKAAAKVLPLWPEQGDAATIICVYGAAEAIAISGDCTTGFSSV